MVLLLLVSVPALVAQAPQNEPTLIVLNRNVLYASKQAIRRQQSKVMPAYERLIDDANKMLDVKPFSVMSKKLSRMCKIKVTARLAAFLH